MLSSEPNKAIIVSISCLLTCNNDLHFRRLEQPQEQIQYQTYIPISMSYIKVAVSRLTFDELQIPLVWHICLRARPDLRTLRRWY